MWFSLDRVKPHPRGTELSAVRTPYPLAIVDRVNDVASAYSKHEYASGSHNNSWSNLFDLIPPGTRVLDVGCSTGNFGDALIREKSCTVIGVDTNAADIAIAQRVLTEAYVLDITEPLPTALHHSFDVVVFADVIEHLPDPRSALRSLKSVLAPGGFVAYSIPHMGHLSVRLDLLQGKFPYTETGLLDRTHFHFYDRQEVVDVFSDAGYYITNEVPVVVQYPESWLVDRLAQLGLTAGPEFFNMVLETESQVFQYIGIATPNGPGTESPRPRERVMPNDEIIGYVQALIDEKTLAQRRTAEAERQVEASQADAAAYEVRFNHAVRHPLRALVRRVLESVRRKRNGTR